MKKRKLYQPPKIDVIIFSGGVQESFHIEKNIQRKGCKKQAKESIIVKEKKLQE